MVLIKGGVDVYGVSCDILTQGDKIVSIQKQGDGSSALLLQNKTGKTGDGSLSYSSGGVRQRTVPCLTCLTDEPSPCRIIDATGLVVAPGLVDIHVHFREPGFEYKEDILTGAAAAAAGGLTTCCCMPNTLPVIDSKEILDYVTDKAKSAEIKVLPLGAVTIGQKGEELTDFKALIKAGAVALSDDGVTIKNDEIMRAALLKAKESDILIISHCEEEEPMVKRDIKLAEETGSRVHIAHVSTASAVETIRNAKSRGVKVTAEAAPHHFSLTEEAVAEKGTLAKMSPPLRKQKDVDAIIQGLCDGTIDAIATDHAPHSIEEKTLPYNEAPNGVIGLESLLAVTLTSLYHTDKLSLAEIIKLVSTNPAEILTLDAGQFKGGRIADIVIFDPDEEWTVDPSKFRSKARNTPFGGKKLRGKVKYTISRGQLVYQDISIN